MNSVRFPKGALFLATLLSLCLAPFAAAAQSTDALILERRLDYEAAQSAYTAAEDALNVVEAQFQSALAERDRARRANDQNALERALREALTRSVPVANQQRRLEDARETLVEARQALINVLIVRQQELIDQLGEATSAAERNRIDILLRDNSLELDTLETQAADELDLGPIAMPNIAFDPRDGPQQLLFNAEILERSAAVTDSLITSLDGQVDALQVRLQRERSRRDFLGGVDRFGDRIDPTVTGPPGSDPPVQATDSTVVGGLPVSLEARVQALMDIREDLVIRRDNLLLRAQMFRERIRRRS